MCGQGHTPEQTNGALPPHARRSTTHHHPSGPAHKSFSRPHRVDRSPFVGHGEKAQTVEEVRHVVILLHPHKPRRSRCLYPRPATGVMPWESPQERRVKTWEGYVPRRTRGMNAGKPRPQPMTPPRIFPKRNGTGWNRTKRTIVVCLRDHKILYPKCKVPMPKDRVSCPKPQPSTRGALQAASEVGQRETEFDVVGALGSRGGARNTCTPSPSPMPRTRHVRIIDVWCKQVGFITEDVHKSRWIWGEHSCCCRPSLVSLLSRSSLVLSNSTYLTPGWTSNCSEHVTQHILGPSGVAHRKACRGSSRSERSSVATHHGIFRGDEQFRVQQDHGTVLYCTGFQSTHASQLGEVQAPDPTEEARAHQLEE